MDGKQIAASGALHPIPLDNINGYDVKPGFYEINGATALSQAKRKSKMILSTTAKKI